MFGPFEQQEHRADQEAHRAHEGAEVGHRNAQHLGGPGYDVAGDGGKPERERSGQVHPGDPPGQRPRPPRGPAVAHLEPRERTGDQEAGRAEGVGTPDMMPCLRRADGRPDGDKGADVELDGPHGLHAGRQPVDLTRQEDEDLPAGGTRPLRSRIDRLAILQETRCGEEHRPDEKRHRVRPAAHGVHVPGHRAQREKERADGEQHPHPPVPIVRRPPRRAAWRSSGQMLAVRARFPVRDHAIRAPADDEGDERPEPAFLCRFCFRGHQEPSVIRAAVQVPIPGFRAPYHTSSRGWVTGGRAASPDADEVAARAAPHRPVLTEDPRRERQCPTEPTGAGVL